MSTGFSLRKISLLSLDGSRTGLSNITSPTASRYLAISWPTDDCVDSPCIQEGKQYSRLGASFVAEHSGEWSWYQGDCISLLVKEIFFLDLLDYSPTRVV